MKVGAFSGTAEQALAFANNIQSTIKVASSGEATTIAFRKRPNTRSFGVGTCGLSTANRGFPLVDGALLNLTVSTMAARAKTPYGDVVTPDELIVDQAQADQRALAWLRSSN